MSEAVSALTDEEIVRRVLDGETELFEAIVRRHNQRLFRVARAILRDDAAAEDVMQEAYFRAFTKLGQFAGEAKFSTWLTRIAVYDALGRLRRAKSQQELSETMHNSDNPERAAYDRELQSGLEQAIDALPPMYRSVFVLREIEEMSVAETADCLSITPESVKTRLHRARALLRTHLEPMTRTAAPAAFSYLGARCDRLTSAVMERIRKVTDGGDPVGTL
jgi:RNA polymerase sigma-70 factor (ECF subfamily)